MRGFLTRRFDNEEPASDNPDAGGGGEVTAEDVVLTTADGRVIDNAVAPGVAGMQLLMGSEQAATQALNNAALSTATAVNQRLTTYVSGYRLQHAEEVANFIAPPVQAPLTYEYLNQNMADAFQALEDDQVGGNGLPGVVTFNQDTASNGKLKFRGLETPFPFYDQQAAASGVGTSIANEEQRRSMILRAGIGLGIAKRVITAAGTAAGSATAVTWYNDTNIIEDIDEYIQARCDALGCDRSMIRMLIGSSVWSYLKHHPTLQGSGSSVAKQLVTKEMLADFLELDPANMMASYVQATSSKKGQTAAKAKLLTTSNIFIFPAVANPQSDGDPSWMKRFYMPINGQMMASYRNQTHGLGTYNVGLAYFEDLVETMSSQVTRLAVTRTETATP